MYNFQLDQLRNRLLYLITYRQHFSIRRYICLMVVTYAIGIGLFPVVKLLQIGAVLIIGFGCGVIVISIGFHRSSLCSSCTCLRNHR
jgi:fatty-acid desaturase